MWRLVSLVALCAATVSEAEDVRAIRLVPGEGAPVEIGQATFADDGTYSVAWTGAAFEEHFLSMRPFRCVPGAGKLWCHVPYPYEIRRDVSEDLTDLEYDLMFVWKDATEYGIDLWNGVYYRLEEVDGRYEGVMHEMDMGRLAVPPEAGDLRPVADADLHPADAGDHAFPRVVIE